MCTQFNFSTFAHRKSNITPKSRNGTVTMEVTGNIVKAKIAQLHNIDIEKVVMNTLYWKILALDHAALVWYGIKGDAYDLPYSAVAIDDEVYINEACELKDASDIINTDTVWVRISDGVTFNGAGIMEFVEKARQDSICAIAEAKYDIDLEVEVKDGMVTYRTMDGSPMNKDLAEHIWKMYGDCKGERSRDYVRNFLK